MTVDVDIHEGILISLCLGSVEGVISTIDLDPCESEPCQLKKGTNYTAHINFTASK